MMRKLYIFFLLILIYSPMLFPQKIEHSTAKPPKYFIGLGASSFSAYGLSFQYKVSPVYQLKLMGLATYNSKNTDYWYSLYDLECDDPECDDIEYDYSAASYVEKEYNINTGFEWQTNLRKTDVSRFYWFYGSGFHYKDVKIEDDDEEGSFSEHYIEHTWKLGLGFGMEFIFFNSIALNFDLGSYAKMQWSNFADRYYRIFSLGGGIGIHYIF